MENNEFFEQIFKQKGIDSKEKAISFCTELFDYVQRIYQYDEEQIIQLTENFKTIMKKSINVKVENAGNEWRNKCAVKRYRR